MPIAYYERKKIILAKKETTYGTDASPAADTDSVRTLDFSIQPMNMDAIESNEDKANPGADVQVLVGKNVVVSFGVFMAGAGTAGDLPAYDPLFAGCGYVGDNTTVPTEARYTQVFPVTDSLTIHVDIDGKLHALVGARGSLEIVSEKRSFPRFNFTFTGKFVAVDASTIDPADVDTSAFLKAIPFRASTVDVTLFGETVAAHSFTFTSGESVAFRETSVEETIEVEDRISAFATRFDEPDLGTYDFWDDIDSEATGALVYVHGTVAGNIVEIDCGKVQITSVNNTPEQGGLTLDVSGPVVSDSSNGFSPVDIVVK